MSILFKFLFYLKKPKMVVFFGESSFEIPESVVLALGKNIKSEKINLSDRKYNFLNFIKSETIIIRADIKKEENVNEIEFLMRESCFSILILSEDLNSQENKTIERLLKKAGKKGVLIAESQFTRKIENENINICKVGFEKKNDFHISDLKIEDGTNFKITSGGDIVPFWFNEALTRKQIVKISIAVGVAVSLGLNLVQISQNIKK